VQNELVEQYGKKPKKWPEEAFTRWTEAKWAYGTARRAVNEVVWFGDNEQKDVDDSVKDLRKALLKKKRVRLVDNLGEAMLAIEVLGRARAPVREVLRFGSGSGDYAHVLSFAVAPGPRLDLPAKRAKVMEWHEANDFAITWRMHLMEIPRWEIEVAHFGMMGFDVVWGYTWRSAALAAANAIDKFVKKNSNELDGAVRPDPPRNDASRTMKLELRSCR
jgi:hypothetical protein